MDESAGSAQFPLSKDSLRFPRRFLNIRALTSIIIVIFLLNGLLTLGRAPAVGASGPSSLALDGSAVLGCGHSTNSCSTTLTTSHPGDIIIAYTFEALNLQPTNCTFSVSDSAGLSWIFRAGAYGRNDGTAGTTRDQVGEFWARASNPLSSDNVTESIAGCASTIYGGEYNALMVFGISGANFNNPFDSNKSLPATNSSYSNTPDTKISTSNPNDMIIGVAQQTTYPTLTPGSGFTLIFSGGGYSISEYELSSVPISGFPVNYSDGAAFYWEAIGDAVQASTTPDFFISASPGSLTLAAGSSGTSTITVTSLNGFSGTVSLTTNSSGRSQYISKSDHGHRLRDRNLMIAANSNGTYTIQVIGTSGSLSHTTSVSIVVPSGGIVCLTQPGTTTCPQNAASLTGPTGTQLRVSVFTQESGGLNGFDIVLLADHTILRPVAIDLTGTVLLGTPVVVAECLGGILVRGASCNSADTADTLELAATSAFGQPNTPSPTTGLLFTAIYNITGTASNVRLGFQTGCGSSSTPTSDTPFCVDVTNGSPAPVPEYLLGATFTELQALTTSFNGVTFQVESRLTNQSSTSRLVGTVQVTASNSSGGQVIFTRSYSVNVTFPATQMTSPVHTVRFVLLISILRDGILCSSNAISAPLIQCFATYNPDVYNQGQVNIVDASALALAYGSSPGSPHWNPYFDFDLSGTIGIQDVSVVFLFYGASLVT